MNTKHANDAAEFIITHEFNAPKELVFNAFSDADALNEWWGPVECKNTVIKLDFKPGGIFHFKMDFNGNINYGRFIFGKIQPHDLLEFTNAFADENANVVPAPFDIKIPKEIFYRLRFTEDKGKTTITLTGQPVNATAEESAGFKSINADMKKGFGATFDKLGEYLSKTQVVQNA